MEEFRNLTGVQRTLLLPLWSRSRLTVEGNSVLLDPRSVNIVKNIQYDFGQIDRCLPYSLQIMNLVRAKMFDNAIVRFLVEHPRAIVANLGAGLDTTFSRVDNGSLIWYDIDLPDVIHLRRQLIPETDRSHCISESLFEMEWVRHFKQSENGVFFVSGGVLEYFNKQTVRKFFKDVAARLPGSQIVFNTTNSNVIARFFVRRMLRRMGIKADSVRWGIDFVNELQDTGNGIMVLDQFPLFSRIEMDEKWGKNTIRKLRLFDAFRNFNIVQLKLGSS